MIGVPQRVDAPEAGQPALEVIMAKAKPLPPVEVLREHFSYDPETGIVTRIKTSRTRPDTLGPVGSPEKHGHLHVKFKGKVLKVHRLAWSLHTGQEPPQKIDHKNGNPADNCRRGPEYSDSKSFKSSYSA